MDKKELHVKENFAIEELSRDLKTNKFVKGEMQFTDITNAVYFLRAYGDIIRYCYSWKKFLIWDGSNWIVDSRGQVESMCLKFVHKMYFLYQQQFISLIMFDYSRVISLFMLLFQLCG